METCIELVLLFNSLTTSWALIPATDKRIRGRSNDDGHGHVFGHGYGDDDGHLASIKISHLG